jgi:DNA polymerase-3 subunit delta
VKYVELKKFTEENGVCPVYVFEGEECYFLEGGEKLLLSQFRLDKLLDYASFDGATLKGDKIRSLVSAVECFPFMSEKRVVKVTEFYPTEKDFDSYLKPLFDDPPMDSILLLVNSGKGKTGTVALAKKPNVTYVDCARSDEETIKKWIYLTCKKEGVYVDGITSGKIATYCILDMARIAKETEKLLCYCQAKGLQKLTDEIVDELVYPDSEYKLYELTGAVARKNYTAFVRISNELMTKGFNELSLLSSLASYFKGIYETSMMPGSDKDIATALGVKEYAVKKNREQASKMKTGEWLRLYESTYSAICDVKSGKLTPPSALKTVSAKLFFGNL